MSSEKLTVYGVLVIIGRVSLVMGTILLIVYTLLWRPKPQQQNLATNLVDGSIVNISAQDVVFVVTDPMTGVQYLVFDTSYKGGITPRLNPDGTPVVVDVPDDDGSFALTATPDDFSEL